MDKKLFTSNLKAKMEIEDVFMVKYIAVMESRDGRPYLNLVLCDKDGDIECRKWSNAKAVAENVEKGDFVAAKGRVNAYQGRLQLIVQEVEKLEAKDFNQDDFVAKSTAMPEQMYEELLSIVDGLSDYYIKQLLLAVLNDPEISRRLKLWPAGKTIHHAYQSGLLEHILSCSQLGVSLSKHYNANVNYVVAGCILHDLCKIYELSDGPIVDYTEEGKLIGHLVKGLEIVDTFAMKMGKFPYETKMHIKHILLSHHGEYDYGSPKIPKTSEAYLVHLIDHMDSKMNALETIKKNDKATGRWSGMVRHLNRVIYKDELPFHDAPMGELSERERPAKKSEAKKAPYEKNSEPARKSAPKRGNPHQDNTELKTSMAGLLENLKLEE